MHAYGIQSVIIAQVYRLSAVHWQVTRYSLSTGLFNPVLCVSRDKKIAYQIVSFNSCQAWKKIIVPLHLVTSTGFWKAKLEYSKYDIEIWFIFLNKGGGPPTDCNWHPPVWFGMLRTLVSMHLAMRVNAFGFTANTHVNASHAQNSLVQFFTISSDDVYSSLHLSEIDFQTSHSRTHKTIWTNKDRKTDKCSRYR